MLLVIPVLDVLKKWCDFLKKIQGHGCLEFTSKIHFPQSCFAIMQDLLEERCSLLFVKDAQCFCLSPALPQAQLPVWLGWKQRQTPQAPREALRRGWSCVGFFRSSKKSPRLILKEDFIWTATWDQRRRRWWQTREAVEPKSQAGKRQGAICVFRKRVGTSCLSDSLCTQLPGKQSKFSIEAAGGAPGHGDRLPAQRKDSRLLRIITGAMLFFHQHTSPYRLTLTTHLGELGGKSSLVLYRRLLFKKLAGNRSKFLPFSFDEQTQTLIIPGAVMNAWPGRVFGPSSRATGLKNQAMTFISTHVWLASQEVIAESHVRNTDQALSNMIGKRKRKQTAEPQFLVVAVKVPMLL